MGSMFRSARIPVATAIALLVGLCQLPALHGQNANTTSPAEFEATVSKGVMVPARDGIRLATDIYRPARAGEPAAGQFPVLVTRTPYGKNAGEAGAKFFAERGYVVLVQDVRGRYDSEGTFYIYAADGKDGYDTIEWAARQPWSNGMIGTFGSSYQAGNQNSAALEKPPHLKAMFQLVGSSNYWEDGAGRGGAFYLLHNLPYALSMASSSKEALADPVVAAALKEANQQLGDWLRAYPLRNPSPLSLVPSYERFYKDWVEHPAFDSYWKQKHYDFEDYYAEFPDVPVYFISGWYDLFLRGAINGYVGMSKVSKSPKKLLIGPWPHGIGRTNAGDVSFGSSAAVDIQNEQLRWFDQTLKNRDTGILKEPPVRVFTMAGGDGSKTPEGRLAAGGEWKTLSTWPMPGTAPRSFYLRAGGELGELPTEKVPPSTYLFDPSNPVPTIGGAIDSGGQLVPSGPRDQRCTEKVFGCRDSLPLSARKDVLVFQTPPLQEELDVTGPVSVELWVSSSARDTDFTAKLVDLYPPTPAYPNGYAMNITDRIVRARFRNSLSKPEPLEPGQPSKISIDLLSTSMRFRKGHRLRVDISSSNFPFYDVNPNTGDTPTHSPRPEIATNSVFHDREHASRVILPIVPTATSSLRPER